VTSETKTSSLKAGDLKTGDLKTGELKTAVYKEGLGFLSPTADIIEDMRNGRMVILVDAEDRENEGDLVIPAQMATPDAVNFMAKHGRGLICLSLTQTRAEQLRLSSMVPTNASRTGTAFTVSIEAREGITTGISAHDRARTIATAIDASKGHDDVVSPGHVFPLVARDGGVLVRAGHTEASIDLARLAGLSPAAVICEIMNDDGTMARMPDLVSFAQRHGLKIGTIEDLIAFRLQNDRIVKSVVTRTVDSVHGGKFDLHVYETVIDASEHLALVKGDLSQPGPVLVRVHAVNALADLLGIRVDSPAPSDGGSLIEKSMRMIEAEGRGVVVLIRDLRPKSISDGFAARAGRPQQDSKKTGKKDGKPEQERRLVETGIGSQILRDLGVRDMVLLSNSPASVYVGLEGYGLKILETRKID
jgi:3,4-dihydroxy 2-butanone 4-phosphate synthase / GTP cyclohydrolase II